MDTTSLTFTTIAIISQADPSNLAISETNSPTLSPCTLRSHRAPSRAMQQHWSEYLHDGRRDCGDRLLWGLESAVRQACL
eukprot:5312690-Pleurochrysis_carterae.AAC.2